MARTINGDHERYLSTYLSQYQHHYFTGDGAYRDPEGFFWIIGRVDGSFIRYWLNRIHGVLK
jgi:acetyl-CoA synthetase